MLGFSEGLGIVVYELGLTLRMLPSSPSGGGSSSSGGGEGLKPSLLLLLLPLLGALQARGSRLSFNSGVWTSPRARQSRGDILD